MTHTNKTTQAIINLVTLIYGGFAVRINTSGIPIIRNGNIVGWRKSKSIGMPDIDGCYKSYSFKVEIKTGEDKLSEQQINFIQKYEEAGGKCFVVKDSEDFEKQFRKYFKIK